MVLFVPQQEAWVVERMGRFHRILEPVRTYFCPLWASLNPNPLTTWGEWGEIPLRPALSFGF